MVYRHIRGLEADRNRRILKDIQWAKRHKDLAELHEYKEKMRTGTEDMSKSMSYGALKVTSRIYSLECA